MWVKICNDYTEGMEDEIILCWAILKEGFWLESEEIELSVYEIEHLVHILISGAISRALKDLNGIFLWKFKSIFMYDSKDKKRDWKKIAEEDIEKIWESCFNEMRKYYDWFLFS